MKDKPTPPKPDIERLGRDLMRTRHSWIDAIIAMFLREENCRVSEVQLVEKIEGTRITWHLERRRVD
jgi:hypothetical protein